MSFTKSTIKIPSATAGWNLDTWEYLPTGNFPKPYPVIVMAHGLSANKMMSLAPYAESFAALGYACLVFDYRRWGASDGTPRHIVDVKEQLEDYRTVIRYARQQEMFDGQRLILWGTSFSGGHVISLAAEDGVNAVAVISRCPYTGRSPPIKLTLGFVRTVFYAIFDSAKQSFGLRPVYIPAAAPPGSVGAMVASGSVEGLTSIAVNNGDWPNQMSASSLFQIPPYDPRKNAASIKCPIFVIICGKDVLCPAENAQKVVEVAPKGEALLLEEAGHFDIYPGTKFYEASVELELEFLRRVVPV